MGNTADTELEVHESTGGYLLGSWRNVMIALWDDTPALPAVKSLRRHLALLAKKHPGGIAFVNASAPSNPAAGHPDDATRNEVLALRRDPALGMRAMAMLFGGRAFSRRVCARRCRV